MNAETEALARRAVACAAWRWMPGMLTMPFHENGQDSPVCHPPWRVTREGVRGPYAHPENNDAPPDLTDPATLGCLLALVREAWPGVHVWAEYDYEWTAWCIGWAGEGEAPPDDVCEPQWPSEAAALVAALKAAAPVRR